MSQDRNSSWLRFTFKCLVFYCTLYPIQSLGQDREADLRTWSITGGFGFPEYIAVSGSYQFDRHLSLSIKVHRNVLGHDPTIVELGDCRGEGCGFISGTSFGGMFTYYFSREVEHDWPNAIRFEIAYLVSTNLLFERPWPRGGIVEILGLWEDISKSGFSKYVDGGISIALINGVTPLIFPSGKFGLSFNF